MLSTKRTLLLIGAAAVAAIYAWSQSPVAGQQVTQARSFHSLLEIAARPTLQC